MDNAEKSPVNVIVVCSGKGGVGKTNCSINLSIALAQIGKKVLLMDADLGLANVDVLLGLKPEKTLHHVMQGECSIDDTIIDGPFGIGVIPASSGVQQMADLSEPEHAALIHAFSEIKRPVDTLIIDSAAGIHKSMMAFAKAAQQVLVLLCDEPSSLADAYALIKVMYTQYQIERFSVVANMVHNQAHGQQLFNKLQHVTEKFFPIQLQYLGPIPEDEMLKKAVRQSQAVTVSFPTSKSSKAYHQLAKAVAKLPIHPEDSAHIQFFLERLLAMNTGQESLA
ncbi:MAG: MinD/ParA family protein [Pseudomonadales bacterium]|nr:MinD/ParA family protein [Pseudomonadales bacterium]